jgi:hypothetical protein
LPLSLQEIKLLDACQKRLKAHKDDCKNRKMSEIQMQKLFGAKLLKPQRLIHIGLEEEERRVQESWYYYDWTMWLACFSPLEELGQHVANAQSFRDNVENTVISHSDQMPFYVKLRPGKQLYMKEETTDVKKKLTPAELASKVGESTTKETQLGAVSEEGMSQLRGECHGNQDKFRITVDLEQVVYGMLGKAGVRPHADFGLTSVIFTGQHFRERNVDQARCYIEDEKFYRDGIEVCHLAGTKVEAGLGNQILDFRDEHPELFQDMIDLGMRFYQQPAGFEDSLISVWKVQEQLKVHGQNLSLRDLFTGALSTWARNESFLCQQLTSWIRGKVTAVCQTADCVVIKPVKCKTAQKHIQLRKELQQLAALENTRAVFKCGMYEIMRTLHDVIKECRAEFKENDRLLKGMYGLGWCCLRPDYEQEKMVDCTKQEWCSDWRLGGHRIQHSWLKKRFSHMDEGVPKPNFQDVDQNGFTEDCDQTYMVEQGETRTLEVWKQMLENNEITEADLKDFQEEPWFECEIQSFEGIQGIEACAELLKTPAQQRLAKGIDPKLTSQKRDGERLAARKRTRALRADLRKPLRLEACKQMRELREQGYSIAQVSAQLICPELGKGKKAKKKFRDCLTNKFQMAKAKAKAKAKAAPAKDAVEAEVMR